jgi:Uma2 family endonuclease
MSTVKPDLDRSDVWTEEAYLSLGETKARIELIDGGLWVSPSANIAHNVISRLLANALAVPASAAGLLTVQVPNLRLAPGRILIPDIAVGGFARAGVTAPAFEAALVVEITSPGNATVDRTLKKVLYAAAKIDWYLLVEPDFGKYTSVSLCLLRREADKYVVHAEAMNGETLVSDEPFPIELDTTALLDF